MSVPLFPALKATVRTVDLVDCQAIAQQVLGLESAGQVREALRLYCDAAVETSLVMEN